MSKIYVELRSGIGNQLFQFAFGYSLACRFNKELVLCPAYFDPAWKYWLKKLLRREARSFRLPLILTAQENIVINTCFGLPPKKDHSILVLDEQKADLSSIELSCSQGNDIYLKGYWQNPEPFLKHTSQIQKMLTPSFTLSEKCKETMKQLNDRVVGIHIRRGDFLTNTAFGACTLDYYLTAIKTIEKLVKNPTFLVFTNNRNWVETNFPKSLAYKIYSNNLNNNTDLEELFLMARLRSVIISNSTFSWWSAFLNQTIDKHVICPERWFLNNRLQENSSKLVLDRWITLPNDLELKR
jgi:hypothetical protein